MPQFSTRVVLHHRAIPGLSEALTPTDDVEFIVTSNDHEVEEALGAGASVLVTYTWNDRLLTGDLQWVQGTGAGFEQYPLADLDTHGVVLTTASGVHISVAEGAFGLLLSLTRGIAAAARDQVDRVWIERPGPELAGSTIGIVGLGTIGEAFARRAQGWEVELIGYKKFPDLYGGVVGKVYGPGRLLELCEEADVLVITLPGSAETHHLIGETELRALGAGWLINVGRGSVIDEVALIDALQSGRLRGAGLDVFESEPLPKDSPLWDFPNVVITPHNQGNSTAYASRLARILDHNLRVFLGVERNWINRVVGGRRHGLWPADNEGYLEDGEA